MPLPRHEFSSPPPYGERFKEKLEAISPGLSDDLGCASALDEERGDLLVAAILERACQCANFGNITLGQEAAAELPREWLLGCIERVAEKTLNWEDDRDYTLLLNLAEALDASLLIRFIDRGLRSQNKWIVEAARSFQS